MSTKDDAPTRDSLLQGTLDLLVLGITVGALAALIGLAAGTPATGY